MRPGLFARVSALMALSAAVMVPPVVAAVTASSGGKETTRKGYYRDPAVHGDTIVFTSEGDLWTVSVKGGAAQRLTTAPGVEHKGDDFA